MLSFAIVLASSEFRAHESVVRWNANSHRWKEIFYLFFKFFFKEEEEECHSVPVSESRAYGWDHDALPRLTAAAPHQQNEDNSFTVTSLSQREQNGTHTNVFPDDLTLSQTPE